MVVYKLGVVCLVLDSFSVDKVNDTDELVLSTDRKCNRNCGSSEFVLDILDATEEVGTYTVHLVDIGNLRNTEFVCLTPYGLGLWLNFTYSIECSDSSVKHTE